MARNANGPTIYAGADRGYGSAAQVLDGIYTMPATNPAVTTALGAFGVIPANKRVIGYTVWTQLLDSNGTPVVAFSVGEPGSLGRFVSANVQGRLAGGGVTVGSLTTGINYVTTADTPVVFSFNTLPATIIPGAQVFFSLQYVDA